MPNKYWLLRGCLTLGKFNAAGAKIGGVELHNTELTVTVANTLVEHKKTCNEVTDTDARDVVETMVTAAITIDQVKGDVLALAFGGETTTTASGATFTAGASTTFPTGLAVGDVVPIPGGWCNLASLVITDSTGSPVTLVAGTDYTADLSAGTITILDLTDITQPLKAAGEENDAFDVTSIATETKQERWAIFKGININDGNKPVILQLHRLSIDPVAVQVKNAGNEYSVFSFEPTLLTDENAPTSSTFGKYGRLVGAN
jgi:hypothetical protein